jgi:hypothetical protein
MHAHICMLHTRTYTQFREIQKRLVVRYSDPHPSDLKHMDTLLDFTYRCVCKARVCAHVCVCMSEDVYACACVYMYE